MKILYNIISTKSYKHRIDNILGTWLSGCDDHLFFSDAEYDDNEKIIKTLDSSDYFRVSEKLMNGIKYIFNTEKNKEYDWFVFCDCDTYIFKNNLKEELKNYNYDELVSIGYVWSGIPALNHQLTSPIYPEISMRWLSGGAGFVVSKKLLEKIYEFDDRANKNLGLRRFSDVYMSYIINMVGGKIIHNNKFNYDTPQNSNIDINDCNKYISFHYIKDGLMEIINKYDI